MKKIALFLALVLVMNLFAACGGTDATGDITAPEGTTAELIEKIYENVTVELALVTMPVDTADVDGLSYMTGLTDTTLLTEGSVSEPMIGAQAYSLVLVRAADAAKAGEIAQSMFDNIDTRKWICVEATEKQAVVCGDLVMFIMLDPQYGVTTDQIVEAFTAVCGGQVGTILK